MPGRVGKGDTFPMRKLPYPRLAKRGAVDARNVDGVSGLFRIELHQAGRRECSRKSAVGRMIPTARANAGGVAKATLHFVSKRDRGDQLATVRTYALRHRERGGDVIARVGRFFRKIGVVVIEIADATAGREGSPIRRRLVIGADDSAAIFCRKIRRDFTRNHARLFVPGPEGATERVDHAAFHLVHDLR